MYIRYCVYIICILYLCAALWCDEARISPVSEAAGTEKEENLDSVAFSRVHNLVSTEEGQPGTNLDKRPIN